MESKDATEKMEALSLNESKDSLLKNPFFEEMKKCKGPIIIAGCGGGYDIYCGIPLYFALKSLGKQVILANLTFTHFENMRNSTLLQKDLREITSGSQLHYAEDTYFPEKYLCQWFQSECKEDVPVYMLNRVAAKPLHAAYQALVKKFNADTVVLIDGGTDSLMRGDEERLGSPHEDMASIAAVHMLTEVKHKYLVCIGFGVDAYHGVSHYLYLENVAALIKTGGFLGCFTAMKEMKEVALYQKACKFSFDQMQTSIVSGSISAAIDGEYGDVKFTDRTGGSKLWINPLMSQFWCFTLDHVAMNRYHLDKIKQSSNNGELSKSIYEPRDKMTLRKKQDMPV